MNGRRDVKSVIAKLRAQGFKKGKYLTYLKRSAMDPASYGVALALKPATEPDLIFVDVYSVVIWDELEKKLRTGLELDDRFGPQLTWSKFQTARRSLIVGGSDKREREERISRFSEFLFKEAIPAALEYCDTGKLMNYVSSRAYREEFGSERCIVAIDLICGGSAAWDRLGKVMEGINDEFEKTQLEDFGRRYFSTDRFSQDHEPS